MTTSNNLAKKGEIFNPYKIFVGSFIPNALMRYKGLSSTAKLVWARLAQYAGEKGECYPSVEKLAEEVGIHKRQCVSVLAELEKNKFIKIVRPEGKDKMFHKTNRYFFLWHAVFNCTSRGAVDCTSGGAVDCTQRESVLRESVLRESSSSLETETTTTTDTTIKDDDDDNFKNIYKKFKEYPEYKINQALFVMQNIEKSGKEIKNRTAYLAKMLKAGFEDIIPSPKKNKTNDDFYNNLPVKVINVDDKNDKEYYGRPPDIKINADDLVSVGDVIRNFFDKRKEV